jgi:hypothetical protein
MKAPAIVIALTMLAAAMRTDARPATSTERAACEAKLDRKIDAISAKLRSGYSADEGERLKARRRKLEAEKAGCRRVP